MVNQHTDQYVCYIPRIVKPNVVVSDVDDLRAESYPQLHNFGIEQIPWLEDLRFEGSLAALVSTRVSHGTEREA